MLNVGLIGAGYWGKILLRTIARAPGLSLKAVADQQFERLEAMRAVDPGVMAYDDAQAILDADDLDAVFVATPAATHYALGRRAIDAGKHLLIEKPMCCSTDEAFDLVERAEKAGVTLMIDHTFLFHPAVVKLGELIHTNALGTISYYDSQRINLGLFQPDVNVLWDLGPHDLAILDFLFGDEPMHIEASGYCHLNKGLPDIAYVTLHYPSSAVAHLNLSWMSPVKVRRVAVGGNAKMAVWDDLDRDEPVKIYDRGISALPQSDREVILPSYRVGDVYSPRLNTDEPLVKVVHHFQQVILGREVSRLDGHAGLRVVRTLERVQQALDSSLQKVQHLHNAGRPFPGLVAAE